MDVKQKLIGLGYKTLGDIDDMVRVMLDKIPIDKQQLFEYLNSTKHPYTTYSGDILQEMKSDDLLMHYMENREPDKTGRWFEYYFEYCCVGVTDVFDGLSIEAQEYLKSKNVFTDYDIRDQLLISDHIYKMSALNSADKDRIQRYIDNRNNVDLRAYHNTVFDNRSAACFKYLIMHMYMHNVGMLREILSKETDAYIDWPDPELHVDAGARRLGKQTLVVAAGRLKFVTDVLSKCKVILSAEPSVQEHAGTLSDLRNNIRSCLEKYPRENTNVTTLLSKYINLDILSDENIDTWEDLGLAISAKILEIERNAENIKKAQEYLEQNKVQQ